MGTKLEYPVWDADNHIYEAVDAYTRHLPKRYEGAIRFVDVNGRDKLEILGKVSETIPNPTYVVIPTPGAWTEYFRGNNPEGKSLRELAAPIRCPDEFRRPDSGLRLMDEQGIDGCVLFPTTAGLLEEHMKADLELTHAVVHAYNEWLLEDWTFDYEGRIIPTPVVTLPDVRAAVAELEWCLDRGAKTVLIRPAPVPQPDGSSVSPGYPQFDPFWELCESAGDLGDDAQRRLRLRPLRDRLGARARRVPGLQPDDLPLLPLRGEPPHLRHARRAGRPRALRAVPAPADGRRRERRRVGAAPARLPSTASTRRCRDASTSTPATRCGDTCGSTRSTRTTCATSSTRSAPDRVLFGSDFPHPEGLGDPLEFVDELADLAPSVVEQVMGGNLQTLLALDTAGH